MRPLKLTPYNKPLTCSDEACKVQQQFLVHPRAAIDGQRPTQPAVGLQHRRKLHDRDEDVRQESILNPHHHRKQLKEAMLLAIVAA
jgi:hypothetical protein